MSVKRINIQGERYGQLTVIAPAENQGEKTAWLCRCDCGKMRTVQTRLLRNGKVRDCGCHTHVSGVETLNYVEGTCIEMIANRRPRINNTSGYTGVSKVKKSGNWRAEIMFCGKKMNLGTYGNIDDAVKARKAAEVRYFDNMIAKYSTCK